MPSPSNRFPLDPVRLVALAGVAAAARAALIFLSQGLAERGMLALALSVVAGHVLTGFALALVGAVVLRACARAPRARPLVFLAAATSAYLFVALRWPYLRFEAPDYEGARSWAAHVGAAVLASILAWRVVAPGVARSGVVESSLPRARRVESVAALMACVLVVASAGWRAFDRWTRPASAQRPNVILISLDSVRGDRLGRAGYRRGTTPNLDRLAASSVRFERAYTPDAGTLVAHASLLTGREPEEHGADPYHALRADVATLAEQLAAEGYVTWAQVGDTPWLDPRFGLARGFAHWRVVPGGASASLDALEPVLDALADRRFFLFLECDDAAADERRVPYEHDFEDEVVCVPPEPFGFPGCDDAGNCGARLLFARNNGSTPPFAPEHARYLEGTYDAGVRTLDRKLGRLFAELEARGLLERSLVVVTSDHGQGFGEHGRYLNADVGPEVTRVPLVLRPPGGTPERSLPVPVSTVDVAACVLEYARGADGGARESVLGRVLSGRGDGAEFVVSRLQHDVAVRTRDLAAVVRAGELVFHDLTRDERELVTERSDAAGDPSQAAQEPEGRRAARLARARRREELGRIALERARASFQAGPEVRGLTEAEWTRLLWLGEPPESVRR